jgi:hypothetical protein
MMGLGRVTPITNELIDLIGEYFTSLKLLHSHGKRLFIQVSNSFINKVTG